MDRERHRRVEAMYLEGKTFKEIGSALGVTRQRAQQMARRIGLKPREAGKYQRPPRSYDSMGSDAPKVRAIVERVAAAGQGDPFNSYGLQKSMALQRGIEWKITFLEWWGLWEEKWAQRGRRSGQYVMCRNGDTGPYEVGNVRIDTAEQNHRETKHTKKLPAGACV